MIFDCLGEQIPRNHDLKEIKSGDSYSKQQLQAVQKLLKEQYSKTKGRGGVR